MNRKIALSAMIIFLLLATSIAYISFTGLGESNQEQKPFYVGVTYGGNNIQDAKTLIDKVADYTNLFVLQSGSLMVNKIAITTIGDYAIAAGLDFMIFFGSDSAYYMELWLREYDGHWGSHLVGIYFSDEPAGKMLDGQMSFFQDGKWSYRKMADRSIKDYYIDENTTLRFFSDGKIEAEVRIKLPSNFSDTAYEIYTSVITYYPDGTTTSRYSLPTSLSEWPKTAYTYEELLKVRPFQTIDETTQAFTDQCNELINRAKDRSSNFTFTNFLTADYALYWFDYLGGYDTVLAELGWNNTIAQEIGLVRGAANLQDKSWGTILTWKYTHEPYLADGDEMFDQMKASYQAGAEYVLVFNYAKDMTGPYGTLKEEHFQALERFWNEVVQNPTRIHGSIAAEAALVLPNNFGWGMRRPSDSIWGLWDPNDTCVQIWSQLQDKLNQYGLKLDIVYDDQAFPAAGKYERIYYWNQTT